MIDQPLSDEYFMKKAFEEAKTAFLNQEVPVGAILVRENKISVIYLAGNHIFKNDKILDNSFNSNGKFILYVGSRSYYKNFKIIVDAIKINKKLSNIKIICFGGEKFSETDKKSFSNLKQFLGAATEIL